MQACLSPTGLVAPSVTDHRASTTQQSERFVEAEKLGLLKTKITFQQSKWEAGPTFPRVRPDARGLVARLRDELANDEDVHLWRQR
jgi:hypothetical protein